MQIESIYIVGWRGDQRFTQCCVASIRHWYPAIDICLIKDEIGGAYDTIKLERAFDVRLFDASPRVYGWGVAKLEPLFLPNRRRVLILDSDIVFAGRVLDKLETANEDFIVVEENHSREAIKRDYFDPEAMERRHVGYRFPGWVFNTGQLVATTGILEREDFLPFLAMAPPLVLSKGGVKSDGIVRIPTTIPTGCERESGFARGEQGPLNFVLHSRLQQGDITLRRMRFMKWPPSMTPSEMDVGRLASRSGYPFLLHWAGEKAWAFETVPMGHVLTYFEAMYQARAAT